MDSNFLRLRLALFLITLLLLAILEVKWPRRKLLFSKKGRWFINLALTVANGLVIKIILGAAAVGVAIYADEHGWGLINKLDLAWPVGFMAGFLFMDLMIYLQHVIMHALPFLWRFHIVHHTDLDFDVTTALRFHPGEALLSMLYKMMLVAAIGADAWTVLIFEVVLNASAQFNHSNLAIPQEMDKKIRRLIITPDMHRIHHSIVTNDTNSNFGFFLSWWDRFLGTYRREPGLPQTDLPLGTKDYRNPDELTLAYVLTMPFTKPRMGDYSMKSGG
ncbi:MAG: sterol desaturase [bacterium]|nr:MAG: sterol desaturase [bacterium]